MTSSSLPPRPSFPDAPGSEKELLEAWARGDRGARAVLIGRHYESIDRFFANRVGNGDHEDLAQATILACLECFERFRGEASFRSLLFAIAHNKLRRYRRDQRRSRRAVEREFLPCSPMLPCAALLREDERQRLRGAVARLPEDTRSMFEAFYWKSMRLEDIASQHGMNLNTVKGRMRRGRQRIAKEVS